MENNVNYILRLITGTVTEIMAFILNIDEKDNSESGSESLPILSIESLPLLITLEEMNHVIMDKEILKNPNINSDTILDCDSSICYSIKVEDSNERVIYACPLNDDEMCYLIGIDDFT